MRYLARPAALSHDNANVTHQSGRPLSTAVAALVHFTTIVTPKIVCTDKLSLAQIFRLLLSLSYVYWKGQPKVPHLERGRS